MIKIKDYILGVFSDIPESREKNEITQEIITNLEEKVQDLIEQGKAEEDAINKAIVEFGDVSEIKNSLVPPDGGWPHKKVNHTNRLWFSIWSCLLIIGLVMFINFYYTPGVIWFVYPLFAVLWWPLGMFFSWLNHREK